MNDPTPKRGGLDFVATALIVIGVLWMALAGLCSAAVFFSSMMSGDIAGMMSALSIVLFFGAIGAAPGLIIWLIGRALRGRRNGAAP
jgi:hypothetical protein